jgi:hypothetical protein
MTRNLKALGLVLGVVFAMGAMTASVASAQTPGELTSDGPVTLHGKHTAETTNALTAFGASTVCNNATYTGHKYREAGKFLPTVNGGAGVTTVTISAHYGPCTAFGFPATVDMNGCDYEFHLEGTTGGVPHTYGVKAFLVCPLGQRVKVTIFSSAANHTAGTPFCTTTITENAAGYTGLHATYLTNGKIRVSGELTGITAHKTGGGFFCPEESTNTAKLDQNIEVEGKNEAGKVTAISITD